MEAEIRPGGTTIIKASVNVDLLGLTIDSKLNLSKYIQTTTHKAALKLNLLWRLSKWVELEVRLYYCQTFVLSKFSYCPLVWYFYSRHDVLSMETVQKWLLRNVYEDYVLPYNELFLKSKLSTWELQIYWFLTTEDFKTVNKLSLIYIQELFEIKDLLHNINIPSIGELASLPITRE